MSEESYESRFDARMIGTLKGLDDDAFKNFVVHLLSNIGELGKARLKNSHFLVEFSKRACYTLKLIQSLSCLSYTVFQVIEEGWENRSFCRERKRVQRINELFIRDFLVFGYALAQRRRYFFDLNKFLSSRFPFFLETKNVHCKFLCHFRLEMLTCSLKTHFFVDILFFGLTFG